MTPGRQAALIRVLRARHIHPLLYLRPWIVPGSAPVRAGLVARTASGAPYYTTTTTGVKIALLDFTNPGAVRFWQAQVVRALDLGGDGFMQDYGEEVLFGMHFADGETGATMHNAYPVLYARATRAAVTRYEHAHPAGRSSSSPAPATADCPARRPTRAPTSQATRRPTSPTPRGSPR